MLVACFVIKLFGWNWFEIVCTNEHFSNLCEFIETNKVAYWFLSYFVYTIPTYFIILSICQRPNPNRKQTIATIISLSLVWVNVIYSPELKNTLEILFVLIVPILFLKMEEKDKGILRCIKERWYYGIIGYLILLAFQIISLITKSVSLGWLNDNLVVTFILLFDYYIMIVLYYLYIKIKKGEKQ